MGRSCSDIEGKTEDPREPLLLYEERISNGAAGPMEEDELNTGKTQRTEDGALDQTNCLLLARVSKEWLRFFHSYPTAANL